MASNSKKRRRVLGASCILAALIIASSSFAWFTSKDEVTNRLSSNADYDVKIVESFAPPKNWTPGQEINKDVYAINTGTVEAFVNEDVSSKLTYTLERLKTQTEVDGVGFDKTKLLTLTADEVDKVKAGAYLAGAFNTDGTEITTVATGAIAEYFNNGDGTNPKTTDDFLPSASGLYFFRRSIGVTNNGERQTFKYDGYYFDAATATYYEIKDIRPNEALKYKAGDRDVADGTLTVLPTYKYVVEETVTGTPKLTYEAAVTTGSAADQHPQRLVATLNTNGTHAINGADVDTAEENVTDKDKALQKLNEAKATLDAAQANYEAAVGRKTAAETLMDYYAGNHSFAASTTVTNFTAIAAAAKPGEATKYGGSGGVAETKGITGGLINDQVTEYDNVVDEYNNSTFVADYTSYTGTDSADPVPAALNNLNAAKDDTVAKKSAFETAVGQYSTDFGQNYYDDIALIGTPSPSDRTYDVWTKHQAYITAQETQAEKQALYDHALSKKNELESKEVALKAKLQNLTEQINANVSQLNTAISSRDTAAADATAVDPDTAGSPTAQAAYTTALNNYNNALKAYNEARATYEANDTTDHEIKVYINLSDDVVTTRTGKDKWQLIPITADDTVAHFYYTSILGSGDSSKKLIDSVELAKEVSQKAYKYFDFDLNIGLDSAQIVYAEDQKTILATAVNEQATDGAFEGKKANLATPTSLASEVYWN